MKYALNISPDVIREARRVYLYREGEHAGSGERFVRVLVDCYARIKSNPNGFQIRKPPYRHAMLHRMRYRLVFKIEGQLVSLVQLRHTSRKPSRKFGP